MGIYTYDSPRGGAMGNSIKIFKSLSDSTRVRILRLLLEADCELCICEIMDSLNLAQYNVSKHAKELKSAGILKEMRSGRFVFSFDLDASESKRTIQFIEDDFIFRIRVDETELGGV